MIIIACLTFIQCLRNRISKILRDAMSDFIFNGLIQSMMIAFIDLAILAVCSLRMYALSDKQD